MTSSKKDPSLEHNVEEGAPPTISTSCTLESHVPSIRTLPLVSDPC